MHENTDFTVYCIEEYKTAEKLSGKEVIELFNAYGVLDYLQSNYEALHTTGSQYIVDDIKLFIEVRKGIKLSAK